jgi:hypothetical protein
MRVTHTAHSQNALAERKGLSKFDQQQRGSRETYKAWLSGQASEKIISKRMKGI